MPFRPRIPVVLPQEPPWPDVALSLRTSTFVVMLVHGVCGVIIFVMVTHDRCLGIIIISMLIVLIFMIIKDVIELDKAFHIYRTSQDVVELDKICHMNHSILNKPSII